MRETKMEMLNRKTAGAFGASIKVLAILERGDFVLAMCRMKKSYLGIPEGWTMPILYSSDGKNVAFMSLKKMKLGDRLFAQLSSMPVTIESVEDWTAMFEICWQIENPDDYRSLCDQIRNSIRFPDEMVPSYNAMVIQWKKEARMLQPITKR